MSQSTLAPTQRRNKASKEFGPFRPDAGSKLPVWLAAGLLLIAIFAAGGYTFSALIQQRPFGWPELGSWVAILEAVNGIFLYTAWRYRRRLSPRLQVLFLDWVGASVWLWALGPFYQVFSMNFNSPQLAFNAFAFFWELPIIGGLAFLETQMRFTPVARYLSTGATNEPEAIYRLLNKFPSMLARRTLMFTILAYIIGTWQLYQYTGLSVPEAAKDIANGVVLSFFLALFYYMAFDQLFGWMRTRVRRQYHLPSSQRKFYQRIFAVVLLVTLGSLSLFLLICVQSFQTMVRNQLVETVQYEMKNAVAKGDSAALLSANQSLFRLGDRGATWVLPAHAALPVAGVISETSAKFRAASEGVLEDQNRTIRVIVFKTVGNYKLVSLVYPTDFYGTLTSTLPSLLIAGVFLASLSVAVTTLFNGFLTRAIRLLLQAVRRAETSGAYAAPPIHSGDEFEDLSQAYETFIDQVHARTEQLHQEQAKLRASIESLSLGFVMTDAAGQVVISNDAVARILGPSGSTGWTLAGLTGHFAGELDLAAACDGVLHNKYARKQWEVTAGSKVLRILMAPIATVDTVIGVVTIIEDITEEQILARSKDEFFSIASHELRTPLTAIRGNTSMIKQYSPAHMAEADLSDMIDDIHDSSIRLIGIVNDFLDLSRLEQNRMVFNYSAFEVAKVVEGVVYEMNATANKKHVYLKADTHTLGALPKVWADQDRTKQIIYNLVGNALKFTDHGGVTIRAAVTTRFVKVTVEDSGPGISDDNRKLLFHKFQQASGSLLTRNTAGGTGLGLYISKILTETMGGKLRLDSTEVGKGSTFSFTLPIATQKRQQSHAEVVDTKTGLTRAEPVRSSAHSYR